MGNTDSSLAMIAVSEKIFLKKVHILLLRYAMVEFSDDFGMIGREGFDRARVKAKLTTVEILDLLFTMWDSAGNGEIYYKTFCIGISPLACPSGDASTILDFALRVSNDLRRKTIEPKDLHQLLTGINSTASYFGDKHLLPDEIKRIVEMVFDKGDRISHEACKQRLLANAYVKRFSSGKARSCVQFKEILEQNFIFDKEKLVTEYIVDDIDTLMQGDETENVSGRHKDLSSTLDNNEKSDEISASGDLKRPSENSVVVLTSASDEPETRDEYSGIHGNAITEENFDGRDPPPITDNGNAITKHSNGRDPSPISDHDNVMTKTSDCRRDPPPTDKYGAPKRQILISYSTYQQSISTTASPRGMRDPPTILR